MSRVSFTWATRRDGNNGYVLEEGPEGHAIEFGPMPPWIVPAFAEARQRLVAMMATKHGASYVEPPDFSFLTEEGKQQ